MQAHESIEAWVAGRLPDDWFTEPPEITVDREEILVVGRLPQPDLDDGNGAARRVADRSRIEAWRESSRRARMSIARQAEQAFERSLSWGARCGDEAATFTTVATPAMTRLRMPERQVLDTLIGAGLARSRSDAIAWCVRLVAERQEAWLADLRSAIDQVEAVARQGPTD